MWQQGLVYISAYSLGDTSTFSLSAFQSGFLQTLVDGVPLQASATDTTLPLFKFQVSVRHGHFITILVVVVVVVVTSKVHLCACADEF